MLRRRSELLLMLGLVLTQGCSQATPAGRSNGGGDGGNPSSDDSGAGGDDLGISPQATSIAITPNPATVNVQIQNGTVSTTALPFVATDNLGNVVAASWQIDRGELGTLVNGTGVFTANGLNAGLAKVTATAGGFQATAMLTVAIKSINLGAGPGSGTGPQTPDPTTNQPPPGGYNGVGGVPLGGAPGNTLVAKLGTIGGTSTSFGLLYPYDNTVWPRGMLAPLLQWTVPSGFNATAISVHLTQNNYEFFGYYSGTNLVNAPVDAAAWRAATDSNGGDPLTVELKITDGTTVLGPLTQHWMVAGSRLRGTVYYNTYNSKLNPGSTNGSDGNGAVLAIQPGASAPNLAVPALKGTCHVCHEVSADGSTLFAANSITSPTGVIYDLRQTPAAALPSYSNGTFTYGGIYPDGSMALLGSQENYHSYGGSSDLFTRTPISSSGATDFTNLVTRAVTPSFSPDGQHVAFNFWSGSGNATTTATAGRTLAVMDFSCGAMMSSVTCGATPWGFSGLRELYTDPTNGHYVGWPSFTPDSKMVAFQRTITACTDGGSVLNTRSSAQAELWLASVPDPTTKVTAFPPTSLCAANGFNTGCATSYLPANTTTNHANDQELNFEPNVTPIAAGGYYWIVFTSRRLYGNVATTDPYFPYQSGPAATSPPTKKLWVAALDPNPKPGKDPSHPAFYLPGQEIMSGNMRAYWVNDPCHAKGVTCQSGDECCTGFCSDDGNGLVCGDKPLGCIPEFGKCSVDTDCCGGGTLVCIGGFCSQRPLQ